MGIGSNNEFRSNKTEYSTPKLLFNLLHEEFNFDIDVCASSTNYKVPNYWTLYDDAFTKNWVGNCFMNPPFGKGLSKWVRKAWSETKKHGGIKVCLIPVRSNTNWWAEVIEDAEVRFIIGEVNFNDEERGLWLPMCIVIFGSSAKKGSFFVLNYRKLLKLAERRMG